MHYQTNYNSPLDLLTLTSDGEALTGIYWQNQVEAIAHFDETYSKQDLPIFQEVKKWLDAYFKGESPEITFSLAPRGSEFRQQVWSILLDIPYGETWTYSDIAKRIAKERGITRMAAQAVGGAVGSNPISIVIPCHRVVGKGGNLTGYGGGMDNKIQLLQVENVDTTHMFMPEK